MAELAVTLKRGKERSLERRHPWVFSGAVAGTQGEPEDGAVVSVLDSGGNRLGAGHYQVKGSIAVRMLAFGDEAIDSGFWQRRLAEACGVRERIGLFDDPATDAFRLVNGEGDGLPGLIVDCFAGKAVIQAHSLGMARSEVDVQAALRLVLGERLNSVYACVEPTAKPEHRWGERSESVEIRENGLRFRVDVVQGQKTGFYLDQRENRALVRRYSQDRRVLNVFSYTGGFSVAALAGGAEHVTSVDTSRAAIESIPGHLTLNDLPESRHEGVVGDALDYLKALQAKFDLVVLDPPAFAKHRSARHAAIQAYHRINAAALRCVASGGILFTFSCSQVVDKDMFRGALLAAAIEAGRRVRILHQLHQPPDHPVSIYHPEGEYLKGFVLHVS